MKNNYKNRQIANSPRKKNAEKDNVIPNPRKIPEVNSEKTNKDKKSSERKHYSEESKMQKQKKFHMLIRIKKL